MGTSRLSKATTILCAIGLTTTAGVSNPVMEEISQTRRTPLPGPILQPITTPLGSVVVRDARTQPGASGERFDVAVFAQMAKHTNDQCATRAEYRSEDALRGLHNHLVLDRGVAVFNAEGVESAGAHAAGVQADAAQILRRPYPLTTIRSIGAGAEGSIIVVAVTTGVLSPAPQNPVHTSIDVVMMYLSGTDSSVLYASQHFADGRGFVETGQLPGTRRDRDFLSVNLILDENGAVVRAGGPATLSLAEQKHTRIRDLRDSLQAQLKVHGERFWEPGL
ncbi:MAG: hypothetical protein KF684_07645 [Phycisphaeraceae bacterium]|nr:hypothetical protein [Phycisphaeraceae bacterium]